MTPSDRLADFGARGIAVSVVRGRLRVTPASALRRDDHAWLAGHWREVATLLDPVPPPADPGPPTRAEDVPVWRVLGSTDPLAVGGEWHGDRWHPPMSAPGPSG